MLRQDNLYEASFECGALSFGVEHLGVPMDAFGHFWWSTIRFLEVKSRPVRRCEVGEQGPVSEARTGISLWQVIGPKDLGCRQNPHCRWKIPSFMGDLRIFWWSSCSLFICINQRHIYYDQDWPYDIIDYKLAINFHFIKDILSSGQVGRPKYRPILGCHSSRLPASRPAEGWGNIRACSRLLYYTRY